MNKIFKKKISIGSWTTTPDNIIFENLLMAPFDFHVIDLEHSSINENQCENLIRLSNFKNKRCFVRLTSNNGDQIKKSLDAGVDGLILPNIKNNNQLLDIFKDIYFPPVGSRGVGLTRASDFGSNFFKYFKNINKDLTLIVIIENKDALTNIESIIKNKKIDAFMIGPYDLSASLGIPGKFNNKLFKESLNKVINLCKKYKKKIGYHLVDPDPIKLKKLSKDFNFIIYSTDVILMKNNIQKIFK